MESSGGGELGDIIRASSRSGGSPGTRHLTDRWQLPSVPTSFPSPTEAPSSGFFDPFSNLCRDPLLQELPATSGAIFHSPDDSILGLVKTGTSARSDGDNHDEHNASGVGGGGGGGGSDGGGGSTSTTLPTFQNKILGEEAARPWNIFSRFLQISPTANKAASPTLARRMRPSPILVGGHDTVKSSDNPLACCNPPNHAGLQISPPSPQAPGIKRRKSQAKKVVCIPAPAAAGSRPSGEVIPSDLWAWRKYGQKPIKGSPYPRGYYRCSSSKGCSARKQVERSRIDPNMLVITYTSEHNHPWPTQRNALAGSTRAQPARTNTYGTSTKGDPLPYQKLEEQREECMGTHATGAMKEEGAAVLLPTGKATVDSRDNNDGHDHLDRVFQQNCKDVLFPEAFRSDDDFFSDLGGLESDPMELVFSKGFLEDTPEEEEEEEDRKKGMKTTLDPFGFD